MTRILVHESTSLWTAELERAFPGNSDVSFRWRPYLEELIEEAHTADVIILVIPPDDDSLDLIRNLRRINDAARLVCLVYEEETDWEHLARECGVTAILSDVAMKSHVVKLVEKLMSAPPARL